MRQILSYILIALIHHHLCMAAQTIQTHENGPVHEAFITKVNGSLLIEAINKKPPEPLKESVPKQRDMQAEWIPGYWYWDIQFNDFVWVSGVWRRPPPGHQWNFGFWKKYDQEWVRIPGYWSRSPEQYTDYIQVPPPNQLDENMSPAINSNYFWVPGHWCFIFQNNEYRWVSGYWEELDPLWVFVPSHYVWRPGGYVYVPAYWDWTIEERGTPYASVSVDPDFRYQIVYEPVLIVQPEGVIRSIFPNYPDYLSFMHHHYHYHPDFWRAFCCSPPWWSWDTWWGLTWRDQWGLWWWYTHPGYPQPVWITKEMSSIIPPPPPDLVARFSTASAPFIVTPRGVVSRTDVLHALNRVSENDLPIVPSHDTKRLNRVQQIAKPVSIDANQILKPLGRRLPIDPNAVRPNVRKPVVDPKALSGVKLLKKDWTPCTPYKPRIPSNRSSAMWRPQNERPQATPQIQERRPTWTPSSKSPHNSMIEDPDESTREDRSPGSWRPRPEWGESSIQRPPVFKPSRRQKRECG